MSNSEQFYAQYKDLLSDVAKQMTEARAYCGGFLSSEHCDDGMKNELTRHFYLCAGAAMYFRDIAPASLSGGAEKLQ